MDNRPAYQKAQGPIASSALILVTGAIGLVALIAHFVSRSRSASARSYLGWGSPRS